MIDVLESDSNHHGKMADTVLFVLVISCSFGAEFNE